VRSRALIGPGLWLPHSNTIVIGTGARISVRCTIYHQVTLGGTRRRGGGASYPYVGPGVTVFAGAKLLGGIEIADGPVIGANAVVTRDATPQHAAGGNPAKVWPIAGVAVPETDEPLRTCGRTAADIRAVSEAGGQRRDEFRQPAFTIFAGAFFLSYFLTPARLLLRDGAAARPVAGAMIAGVVGNVALLSVFKYLNFLRASYASVLGLFELQKTFRGVEVAGADRHLVLHLPSDQPASRRPPPRPAAA
jgi:hypothetical protein